jgi:hypothetical protein
MNKYIGFDTDIKKTVAYVRHKGGKDGYTVIRKGAPFT